MVIDLTFSDSDDPDVPTKPTQKRLRQTTIEASLRGTPRTADARVAAQENGGPGTAEHTGAQHAHQDADAGTPARPNQRRRVDDGAGPSHLGPGGAAHPVTPAHQRVPAAGGAAGSPGPGPSRSTQPAAPLPGTRPRARAPPPPLPAGTEPTQATAQAQTPQGPHGRQAQPGIPAEGDAAAAGAGPSTGGAGPSTAGPGGGAQGTRQRATANGTGGAAQGAGAAGGEAGGGAAGGAAGAGAAGGVAGGAAGPAAGAAATPEAQRHNTWRALHTQEAKLARHREALAGTDADSSLCFLQLAQQANHTLQAIQDPAMAARDAAQHHLLTDAALQASARLERAHGSRTPKDLVDAILFLYAPRREPGAAGGGGAAGAVVDWARLGWDTEPLRRPARGASVMLGPLDVMPKERKAPAARRPRDKVAEVTRAQELQEAQDGSGHDSFTSKIMEEMLTALRRVRDQATAAAGAAGAAGPAGAAAGGGSGSGSGGRSRGSGAAGAGELVQTACGLRVPLGAFRPYREVVLDHAGFAQTMENIAGADHLFTQEALLIYFDEREDALDNVLLAAFSREEMAAVRAARKRGSATVASGQARIGAAGGAGGSSAPAAAAATKNQEISHMLVSYTMDLWRSWCERTPPEACLMRSRPSAPNPDVLDAEGWAGGGAAAGAGGGAGGQRGMGAGGRGGRGRAAGGAGPSGSGGGGRRGPH